MNAANGKFQNCRNDNNKIFNIQSIKGRKLKEKLVFQDKEDEKYNDAPKLVPKQKTINVSKNVILINKLISNKIKKNFQSNNSKSDRK